MNSKINLELYLASDVSAKAQEAKNQVDNQFEFKTLSSARYLASDVSTKARAKKHWLDNELEFKTSKLARYLASDVSAKARAKIKIKTFLI